MTENQFIQLPPEQTKVFIIDADLARAASDTSLAPVSTLCRTFLQGVLHICHRVIDFPWMTQGETEWNRHAARFSKQWKRTMWTKGKVQKVGDYKQENWLRIIKNVEPDPNLVRIMEKDVHLVATAQAETAHIASLDNHARLAFQRRADALGVPQVVWVNPTENPNEVLQWLQDGATPRPKYLMNNESHD